MGMRKAEPKKKKSTSEAALEKMDQQIVWKRGIPLAPAPLSVPHDRSQVRWIVPPSCEKDPLVAVAEA
jgi:hypothetical protein